MARKKTKVKRIITLLNQPQADALAQIMAEDGQDVTSYVIGGLIMQEQRRREESKHKRSPGRPRKTEEVYEEKPEIANIEHPDQFMNQGKYLTATEYEGWVSTRPPEEVRPAPKVLDPATPGLEWRIPFQTS